VRTLPTGARAKDLDFSCAINSISHNNLSSAKWFREQWKPEYNSEPSRSLYSLDVFDAYEQQSEKPIMQFPTACRVMNIVSNDPFQRLSQIAESLTSNHQMVHPLLLILSFCTDEELHPTENEVKLLEKNSHYNYFRGIYAQRVTAARDDHEKVKCVRIFFDGEFRNLQELAFDKENRHSQYHNTFRSQSTTSNYVQLEEQYEDVAKWSLEPSYESRYTEELGKLIDSVMWQDHVSEAIRAFMRKLLTTACRTKLGDHISFQQEVACAVATCRRKKKLIKQHHDSVFKKSCVLSLDCVSDRLAVVATNLSALMNTNVDQTCVLFGDFKDAAPHISRSQFQGMSEFFNMSASDLDWKVTLLHKLLSWLNLEFESVLVNKNINETVFLEQHMVMPSLIMLLNDQKFAQASEMVRYIFINSTGISGGCKNLYDKISWYKPRSFPAKLYLLRMIKMSSLVQWVKALNQKSELLCDYTSSALTDSGKLSFHFKHWKIAFPHETVFIASDQKTYNNFYVCKAFTVMRHNRIMNEAQVILKQLESRESFNHVYSMKYEHESRCLPVFSNKHELIAFCKFKTYDDPTQEFSPDPIVVLLGSLAAIIQTHPNFCNLGQLVSKIFPISDVIRSVHVTEVMNNHGSVSSVGENGLALTGIEKTQLKRKGEIKQFRNQNDRCYHTILVDVVSCMLKWDPKRVVLDWKSAKVEIAPPKKELSHEQLSVLKTAPTVIYPYVHRHLAESTQFVSKMTHKDQIGVREIATLNAASRICCYYVEEVSRTIRDIEHTFGNKVNMIERKDKEQYVRSLFNTSRAQHSEGATVVYDSADCSKWGPSMMPFILYLVQGIRIGDEYLRQTSLNIMKLFSHKVFKIPDAYFMNIKDLDLNKDETNAVLSAAKKLSTMSEDIGHLDKQIICLPESMHQGILGSTSSILAADCQHLSRFVAEKANKSLKLKIHSVVTSDDYSRILMFRNLKEDESSLHQVIKKCLSIHMIVSKGCGIKRNMDKSSHSSVVLEFNSVFYTPSSENRPDIKSRLSYVDLSESYDPYPSALHCMIKGAEFLRNESSLLGATWVQLLNTHLAMMQHQNLPLYSIVGDGIFQTPLELGGYCKIDPLLAVMYSKFLPVTFNYSPCEELDIPSAVRIMMEMRPNEVEDITLDPEDAMRSRVPRMSRSGMIHLCRRDKRTARKVREFLDCLDDSDWSVLQFPGQQYSFLPALLSCMQREESTASEESNGVRFAVPATPRWMPLYRVNSSLLTKIFNGETLVSRDQLHQAAIEFLNNRRLGKIKDTDWFKELPDVNIPFFYKEMTEDVERHIRGLKSLTIRALDPVNKRTHKYPLRMTLVPSLWSESDIRHFTEEYKPTVLGGHQQNIKPRLYFESLMMYRAKIKDLTERKQYLNLVLTESDVQNTSLLEKILIGCFISGCRMVYDRGLFGKITQRVEDRLWPTLKVFSSNEWKSVWSTQGKMTWDVLDERVSPMMKQGLIKNLDLTSLLNASFSTTEMFTFGDSGSKLEVWHSMFKVQSQSSELPFVIDPQSISLPVINEVYQMGINSKIYFNSIMLKAGEVCGMEMIIEKGDVFSHYITMFKDEGFQVPRSTAKDKYRLINISSLRHMKVRISTFAGFMVLATVQGHPMLVLTSGLPNEMSTVFVHFQPTFLTKKIANTLQIEDPMLGLSDPLLRVLSSKMSLYTEEPLPVEDDENNILSIIAGIEGYDNDDFEVDMDDIFGGLDDTKSESTEGSEIIDESDLEEEFDDDLESYVGDTYTEWEEISRLSSYISSHGVFRPTSTLLGSFAHAQIRVVQLPERRKLKKARPKEKCYGLTLPFKTRQTEYASGSTGTGLTELLDELMNSDAADSSWYVSFLRDIIINSKFIMSEYFEFIKDAESDEDWE